MLQIIIKLFLPVYRSFIDFNGEPRPCVKLEQISFSIAYLIVSLSSFAQDFDDSRMNLSTAEKIYVQLSSKVCATDQTIWFKTIVTDTENHVPTKISGVLNIDLIGPNEEMVAHKLVKLNQGIGHGHFELNDDYKSGRYLIRAYTQWNRNFGDDFMFRTYVNIYASEENKNKNIVEGLALIKNEKGRIAMTAQLNLQETDGRTDRQSKVYLNWGKGQDTIVVKRKYKKSYPLAYEIPERPDWITLTLDNGNQLRHTEKVYLKDSPLDVQFFPESGKMVHGLRNKVGFKAVGIDGKGVKIKGSVLDASGNKVTEFESNHLGMGFLFLEGKSSMTYYAKVTTQKNSDSLLTYTLPKAVSKGSALSVEKVKDRIRIRVVSSELSGNISVKASCRGKDHYLIEGSLRKGSLVSELPSAGLPEGIIVFTLLDKDKEAVAERLYFNESIESGLNLVLDTDKTAYRRREATQLEIQVLDNNSLSSKVDISVTVMNKEHWHQGYGDNISSYFLLDSELRGEIEEPGYYFMKENTDRHNNLDALLLTQGWRNYTYPIKRQGETFFWPQPGLMVKGSVQPNLGKKKPLEDINVTMAGFGKETYIYNQATDSTGKFNFLLNDTYGRRMRILLNAKDGFGEAIKSTIYLDTVRSPKVVYKHKPSVQKIHPVELAVLAAKQRRDESRTVFDSLYGVTQLEEVVVEDYRLKSERKNAYKKFGEPDVIINGDDIRKKEKKWSYGLYSILLFDYADQVEIEKFPGGFMLAHIKAGNPVDEPTLLMVDGKLLARWQYELVPHMPPGIVEDVELIKYANFFAKHYLTVFPETPPLEAPRIGHIISLYTKGGVGIQGTGRPAPGTLDTSIDIFSPIKEFYAPKYDEPIPANSQKPDLRSLLYWAPTITTDQTGNPSVTFYNGDVTGDYVIIVEAISEDGRVGYKEKVYHVKDENP